MRGLFPPAIWLREYRAAFLRADLVAGLTLAAYAIAVSIAYAALAGVRMLLDVARELAARGIELRIAEAHATVRDLVQKEDDPALPLPAGRVTVSEAAGA